MHADVEHHHQDPELAQDVDRLVPLQQAEQRRAEEDAGRDLSQDRRIPEPDGQPSAGQCRPQDQGQHQDLVVHQPTVILGRSAMLGVRRHSPPSR